jgi:hypothetical protein
MASSQVPWGLEALNGVVTDAAWKTKPSWSRTQPPSPWQRTSPPLAPWQRSSAVAVAAFDRVRPSVRMCLNGWAAPFDHLNSRIVGVYATT